MSRFFIIILMLTTYNTFAQSNKCDSIVWTSFRKLTWDDYKATPVYGTRVGANTNYNFLHKWRVENNTLIAQVICIFRPCRSWTNNKTSADLLAHEQAHFDMAEYFRRVYNQRISEERYTPGTLKLVMLKTYVDIQLECARMEDRYDDETNHGLLQAKQAEWAARIQKMLDAMQGYDEAEVSVNLNH